MEMTSTTGLIVLRVFGATAAALVGALIALPGRASHKVLCALVSFAAGGLLGVTLTHLFPETVEILGVGPGAFSIAFGLGLFYVIGRYVYALCPACSATQSDKGFFRLGVLMMVAMGLHSLTDGLAIVAGSSLDATAHSGKQLGLLIFVAVSYHKVPEGMALMSVIRGSNYSRGRAFLMTLLIELTTGLGAVAGLLLANLSAKQLGALLGVVAGSFLYVVFFALLKEMWEHEKRSIAVYASLGFLSLWGLGAAMSAMGVH